MNRYLLMSAAALLLGNVGSQAGQQSFRFGTAGGNPYCDGGTGHWDGQIYSWLHTNDDCAGGQHLGGPGLEGKTRGIGNNINMFDAVYGSTPCSIDFPPKFKIGGTYRVLCVGSEVMGSGILLPPNAARRDGGQTPLATAVKAKLAEIRRAREGQ